VSQALAAVAALLGVFIAWGVGEERPQRLAARELQLAAAVTDRSLAQALRASAHTRLISMLMARGMVRAAVTGVSYAAVATVIGLFSLLTWSTERGNALWTVIVVAYAVIVPLAWVSALTLMGRLRRTRSAARSSGSRLHAATSRARGLGARPEPIRRPRA
jgi:hypothetical protein